MKMADDDGLGRHGCTEWTQPACFESESDGELFEDQPHVHVAIGSSSINHLQLPG